MPKMTCTMDHAALATKFCPRCGGRAAIDPVTELLEHIRRQARTYQQAAARLGLELAAAEKVNDRDEARYLARRLASAKSTADKWRRWSESLRSLVGTGAKPAVRRLKAG